MTFAIKIGYVEPQQDGSRGVRSAPARKKEVMEMAKKSRGGRMTAAKKRAAKKPGGKGRVAKRKAGKRIMST
jgi:hypothetical protein